MSPPTRSIGERLAGCGGYTVRTTTGESLGKVAWVRYATRVDCPDTLVVRLGNVFGARHRIAEISSGSVEAVDATVRTVTVASEHLLEP